MHSNFETLIVKSIFNIQYYISINLYSFMNSKIVPYSEENSSKQQPQITEQNQVTKTKRTTLIFLSFGFYFLIFGLLEFITNTNQSHYQYELKCNNNNCSTKTDLLRFSPNKNISIYLVVQDINQNQINIKKALSHSQLFDHFNSIQNCNNYLTNSDMGTTISVNGNFLVNQETAIPCGNLAYLFPKGVLQIYNIQNHSYNTVYTDNILSPYHEKFININLDKQWINLADPRFVNWITISASGVNQNYWGVILSNISDHLIVSLILQRNVNHKYRIILEDNQSFGGYNLSLCYFNIIFCISCFIFASISYWYNNKNDSFSKIFPSKSEQNPSQQ